MTVPGPNAIQSHTKRNLELLVTADSTYPGPWQSFTSGCALLTLETPGCALVSISAVSGQKSNLNIYYLSKKKKERKIKSNKFHFSFQAGSRYAEHIPGK